MANIESAITFVRDEKAVIELYFSEPTYDKRFRVVYSYSYDNGNHARRLYGHRDVKRDSANMIPAHDVDDVNIEYNNAHTSVRLTLKTTSRFVCLRIYNIDDNYLENSLTFTFVESHEKDDDTSTERNVPNEFKASLVHFDDTKRAKLYLHNVDFGLATPTQYRISYCVDTGNRNEDNERILREFAIGLGEVKNSDKHFNIVINEKLIDISPIIVFDNKIANVDCFMICDYVEGMIIKKCFFDGEKFTTSREGVSERLYT